MDRRRPRSEDFTVAWICALPVERVAAQQMLDEHYEIDGSFVLGRIDAHDVVIGCLPSGYIGTTPAAVVAAQIESAFNNIQIRLLVGIGGGVPSNSTDVRLGDVVISQPDRGHGGVVQYDCGKTTAGGRLERTGFVNSPPKFLLDALTELRVRILSQSAKLLEHLKAFEGLPNFSRERAGLDVLFAAESSHVGGNNCDQCDKDMVIPRAERQNQDPHIHYGTIASGNQVMKDGVTRDIHGLELNALCFEMEAAGIMNDFPCLVIRGICDYSDSHKNDTWQPYAAATAAACAKEILSIIPADHGRRYPGSTRIPLFVMPFSRDKYFVGRDAALAAMEEQTRPTMLDEHRRAALVGLGGVGKSQVAIEYGYRIRNGANNVSVFWIHASNPSRFKQAYQEIAERANIPGRDDPQVNILQSVHRWLSDEASGAWLMILDNVDDDKTFFSTKEGRPLESWLPQTSNGSILITSRNSEAAFNLLDSFGSTVALDTMSEEEALKLMETKVSLDGCEDDAKELVRTLGNIPLAIAQTASYIKMRKRITIRKYLQFFHENEERQVELLNNSNRDVRDTRRDHSSRVPVLATWQITFDQVRAENPAATALLSLMSMYDRQGIPEILIRGEMDDYQFEEALAPLLAFSLIREQVHDRTFNMHRLVQISTRTWLEMQQEKQNALSRALERLAHVFPGGEFSTWTICAKLLPHSQEVLKQHRSVRPFVPDLPRLKGRLGWYLFYKGEEASGEIFLRQALKENQEMLGVEHKKTSKSLYRLASILLHRGKYVESEPLFRQAVKSSPKTLGPDNICTLQCSNGLCHVLAYQGKYEEAEALGKETWGKCQALLGPADQETLISMNALASVYYDQARWSEAEALQTHVLDVVRKSQGEENINALASMRNLVEIYRQQHRWMEAEELGDRTLKIAIRVLGEEHPLTLLIMDILAGIYERQKRWLEAEKMASEAIKVQIRLSASVDVKSRSQSILARVYLGQGRMLEGQALLVEAMDAMKSSFGDEHRRTLSIMCDLATYYENIGRTNEAIRLMEDCVNGNSRVFGAAHPYTQNCAAKLQSWKAVAGNGHH